jgi:hypothetical protein
MRDGFSARVSRLHNIAIKGLPETIRFVDILRPDPALLLTQWRNAENVSANHRCLNKDCPEPHAPCKLPSAGKIVGGLHPRYERRTA